MLSCVELSPEASLCTGDARRAAAGGARDARTPCRFEGNTATRRLVAPEATSHHECRPTKTDGSSLVGGRGALWQVGSAQVSASFTTATPRERPREQYSEDARCRPAHATTHPLRTRGGRWQGAPDCLAPGADLLLVPQLRPRGLGRRWARPPDFGAASMKKDRRQPAHRGFRTSAMAPPSSATPRSAAARGLRSHRRDTHRREARVKSL
jgi:hypothetical protein